MRFAKAWTRHELILICSEDPFSLDLAFIPNANDHYSAVLPLLKEWDRFASHPRWCPHREGGVHPPWGTQAAHAIFW
jgi:hypothetical protein